MIEPSPLDTDTAIYRIHGLRRANQIAMRTVHLAEEQVEDQLNALDDAIIGTCRRATSASGPSRCATDQFPVSSSSSGHVRELWQVERLGPGESTLRETSPAPERSCLAGRGFRWSRTPGRESSPGSNTTSPADGRAGGPPFAVERHVNAWPSRKHDHFSIPAGTIHCSGKDNVVLEISATPYIFTFKLWDWERLGLDGKPRPIHLEHGLANIQWDRTTDWVERNLINPVRPLASGQGVREETTGLHPSSSSKPDATGSRSRSSTTRAARSTSSTSSKATWSSSRAPTRRSSRSLCTTRRRSSSRRPSGRYRLRSSTAVTNAPLATIKALVRGSEDTPQPMMAAQLLYSCGAAGHFRLNSDGQTKLVSHTFDGPAVGQW